MGSGDRHSLKLAGNGRDWYAAWLRHGLLALAVGRDSGDRRPFSGAEGEIDRDNSHIVTELGNIRARLDVQAQIDFDAGVTEALQQLDLIRDDDVVVGLELLRLASLTGNKLAVHVLAHLLEPGRSDETARALNTEIVTALAARPYANDPRTRNALYRLIRSKAFNPNLARDALIALCTADPDGLVNHLVNLNTFLQGRYSPIECRENERRFRERRRVVNDIYAKVEPRRFREAIEGWDKRLESGQAGGHGAMARDWLVAGVREDQELGNLAFQAAQFQEPDVEATKPTPPLRDRFFGKVQNISRLASELAKNNRARGRTAKPPAGGRSSLLSHLDEDIDDEDRRTFDSVLGH